MPDRRRPGEAGEPPAPRLPASPPPPPPVTLFLAGDVMTGRGIDQRLTHPSHPRLYEPWIEDARAYARLAEEESGPIPQPMGWPYPWGDALGELARAAPAARVVNLETAVTTSATPWPGKGIHYKMHPENVPVLSAAAIDCCVLANNHVLDWGRAGLVETLEALGAAGIRTAGAGRDRAAAEAPAVLPLPGGAGRLLVFAFGAPSSGIPEAWAATDARPGVALLDEQLPRSLPRLREIVGAHRRAGDLVVASLHWGGNWGYGVPADERELARRLIDEAGVDLVHGHSSHHVKAIEVHAGRPILYGCGDFLTDYEGIGGRERFRGDLALAYLPALDAASGRLAALDLVPLRLRRFRMNRASAAEARWLADVLDREGRAFGTSVELAADGRLRLRWKAAR